MPISKKQLYALLLLVAIMTAAILLDTLVYQSRQSAAVLAVDFETEEAARVSDQNLLRPFGSAQQQADNPVSKPIQISGCTGEGSLPVYDKICKAKNSNGATCAVGQLPDNQQIFAQCQNGCCRAVGYTSGSTAAGGILGAFIQAGSLLSQFLSGGSSSGDNGASAYDYSDAVWTQASADDGFLQYDDKAQENIFGDIGGLAFGNADNGDIDTSNILGSTNNLDGTSVETSQTNTQQDQQTSRGGDTVSTAYEYLKSLAGDSASTSDAQDVDQSLSEEDAFTQDYFETGLDDFETEVFDENVLTRTSLESQGQAILNRNRDYEKEPLTDEEKKFVQNYRSSGVTRSTGFGTNPLANDRFDVELPPEEPAPPSWWQQLILTIIGFLNFESSS